MKFKIGDIVYIANPQNDYKAFPSHPTAVASKNKTPFRIKRIKQRIDNELTLFPYVLETLDGEPFRDKCRVDDEEDSETVDYDFNEKELEYSNMVPNWREALEVKK